MAIKLEGMRWGVKALMTLSLVEELFMRLPLYLKNIPMYRKFYKMQNIFLGLSFTVKISILNVVVVKLNYGLERTSKPYQKCKQCL